MHFPLQLDYNSKTWVNDTPAPFPWLPFAWNFRCTVIIKRNTVIGGDITLPFWISTDGLPLIISGGFQQPLLQRHHLNKRWSFCPWNQCPPSWFSHYRLFPFDFVFLTSLNLLPFHMQWCKGRQAYTHQEITNKIHLSLNLLFFLYFTSYSSLCPILISLSPPPPLPPSAPYPVPPVPALPMFSFIYSLSSLSFTLIPSPVSLYCILNSTSSLFCLSFHLRGLLKRCILVIRHLKHVIGYVQAPWYAALVWHSTQTLLKWETCKDNFWNQYTGISYCSIQNTFM